MTVAISAGGPETGGDSLYRRLFRNISIVLSGNIVTLGLGLAAFGLNARALGPKGLGILALIQAYALIVGAVLSFDTWQPVIKFGSEARETGNAQQLRDVIALGAVFDWAAALLATLIAIGGMLLAGTLLGLSDAETRLAALYCVSICFSATGAALGTLWLFDRFAWQSSIEIASSLVTLGLVAWLFALRAPLAWYIIGYGAISATTGLATICAAAMLCARQRLPAWRGFQLLNRKDNFLRSFATYSLSTSLVQTLNIVRQNGDLLLVGAILSPAAAGLYSAASRLAALIKRMSDPARAAIFPEVSRLSARRDFQASRVLLLRSLAVGTVIGIVALITYGLVGRLLIELAAGPAFAEAYGPMMMLAAGHAVYMAAFMMLSFVQTHRSPLHSLFMFAAGFVGFAFTALVFVSRYGLAAAGASQIVFGVIYGVTGLWLIRSLMTDSGRS